MAICNTFEESLKGCENTWGGSEKVYLTNFESLTGKTYDVNGIMTGGTMLPGATFVEFEPMFENQIDFTEEKPAGSAILYNQAINFQLHRRQAEKRRKLALLIDGNPDILAVVKDNNGLYWIFGNERGLNVGTLAGGSGRAKADDNSYLVTLIGEEPVAAPEINATLFATFV